MIEAMVQAGHPQPVFKATPHSFTVSLENVRERDPQVGAPAWESSMNERQLRAIQYMRDHGSRLTSREYQDLCPDVSPETLRLDMVDLTERGIVLKVGLKRGTYYILK